jgi:hypothetical protein
MDYRVLNWRSANKLRANKSVALILHIEFNLSKVYLLKDCSYLVMPINPFGKALRTGKLEVVNKWIEERYFPAGDIVDGSYFETREKLENLMSFKEELKEDLCQYVFKDQGRLPDSLSAEEIDGIYALLQYKKQYQQFKLNFVVLVGDYIIRRQKKLDIRWGLLVVKQYLNPLISLILITDQRYKRYYNLERQISSKWGYAGVEYFLNAITDGPGARANEILEEIARVL